MSVILFKTSMLQKLEKRCNHNSKIRHHSKISTFSEFHGCSGYSDARVLWIRTYILSYSEDSYQNDISLRTTTLFLTPY
jgi:hypothetical protein